MCVRPLETLRVTVETAVVSVKRPWGKRHLSRVCVRGEYVRPRPITLPGPSTGGAQPDSTDRSPVPPHAPSSQTDGFSGPGQSDLMPFSRPGTASPTSQDSAPPSSSRDTAPCVRPSPAPQLLIPGTWMGHPCGVGPWAEVRLGPASRAVAEA